MASQKIRVVIVDDHDSTVQTLATLLKLEPDFELVGTAGDGLAGIEQVKLHRPDVALMDINMPRMDGITATEVIVTTVPETAVVMLSAQSDNDYLRRSMNVGASYFLAKPVASDELYNAIRRAHEVARLRRTKHTPVAAPQPTSGPMGKVIAFFSPSGGVGRTTIATNLAIALRRATDKRVALADFSLPFGDVAVLLNAPPTARSIGDLIGKFADIDAGDVDSVLYPHSSGVRALLAPATPAEADLVSAEDISKVLKLLRQRHDYIVVDTYPSYGDTILAVLDDADIIFLPLTLELTSVKNARVFIELGTKLGIESKVKLLVNRADELNGLKLSDVETGLARKVAFTLSADEHSLRIAMNRGVPILDSHGASRLSKDFITMARALVSPPEPATTSR